jgi:hypothetical protein
MAVPILYGLVMGGIRILPYAVRYGKDIVRIGYKVIVSGKELKLAQKIFGSKNVIKNITDLGRFSTRAEKFSPIKSKQIINLGKGGTEIGKNISTVADKAANQVSKFIINSPTRTIGGTEVAAPIRSLFGQNIKLSSQTLKNIKLAEAGPSTALGKELIKAPAKPTSAWLKTATQKATVRPVEEIAKKVQEFKAAIPRKELIPTRVLPTERPWYVAVIPKFLRPSKLLTRTEFMATKKASTGQPLTETLYKTVEKLKYPKTTGAVAAATTAAPFIAPAFMPGEKPEGEPVKNLDFEALFGGTTGPLKYKQLKIPGSVGIHDVD